MMQLSESWYHDRSARQDGARGLAAQVAQLLSTWGPTHHAQGEMRWRTAVGSSLHLMPHTKWDTVAEEMTRAYICSALRRWLPQLSLESLTRTPAPPGQLILHLVLRSATGELVDVPLPIGGTDGPVER